MSMSSQPPPRPAASLPSFGELLDSLRETTEEQTYLPPSHHYRRRSLRTPTPPMPAQTDVSFSLIVSTAPPESPSFAESNAQLQSTLPRRSRVRYQPYLSSGQVLARRSSLPGDADGEDSTRVEDICKIKRHRSAFFENANRHRVTVIIPSAVPISGLLRRGGGSSPKSPSSPTTPDVSTAHGRHPSPVCLPTLPSFNLKPVHPYAFPATHHSRDSSMGSVVSVESSRMSGSTDEGRSFSVASLSGGSVTPSSPRSSSNGRPYRVWTASGYRYPPSS